MNSNPALLTRAALVAAAASMIAAHAVSACEHDNALSCVRATFQQVGEPGYYPDLLSLDGSTVVGRIMLDESLEWPHGQLAFRWSRRGSVEELDTLGGDYSLPSGVSANGAVILGTSADLEGAERPFFWTKLTGMHELVLPGGNTCLKAILSPDGTAIAGTLRDAEGLDQAFLWSPCAFSKLGFLPGSVSSEVSGVSGNGQHVIGTVLTTAAETRPFLWSKGKRMRDLGACPHGGVPAPALVSADGKVVIGSEAVLSRNTRSIRGAGRRAPASATSARFPGRTHCGRSP